MSFRIMTQKMKSAFVSQLEKFVRKRCRFRLSIKVRLDEIGRDWMNVCLATGQLLAFPPSRSYIEC